MQLRQQCGEVVLDYDPNDIVVQPQVGMNDPIAHSYDRTPRDFSVLYFDMNRYVRRRFAYARLCNVA